MEIKHVIKNLENNAYYSEKNGYMEWDSIRNAKKFDNLGLIQAEIIEQSDFFKGDFLEIIKVIEINK